MGEVFLGGESIAAGRLTRHDVRRWYQPVFRGVYAPKDAELTLRDRATAAWLTSGRRGVIAGVAASGLHGAPWVDAAHPIELTRYRGRPQPGLVSRDEEIADDELTRIARLPVTTRVRTAFDLGRHLTRPQAIARLDALMWNQRYSIDDVAALGERYPRARGMRQLRELLPLVDGGASSPRESQIRLLLVDAGMPKPETQIPVGIASGIAFLDMGWDEFSVAVEYDGDHHRKDRRQYVRDIARLRMLSDVGWIVIRVIAEDSPAEWLARVAAALRSRGCHVEIDQLHRFVA